MEKPGSSTVTKLKFHRPIVYPIVYCVLFFFITLRSCRGAAHATSRRVALHHPASGTLLLYKQRRSSVLSLGSHSSTRVTSKHGQPTCSYRRVYGEANYDTWRRAALVDRHGDPQHKWTAQPPQLDVITGELVDICRTTRDSARYSFWHDTILHGVSHRARLWHWTLHRTVPVVPH